MTLATFDALTAAVPGALSSAEITVGQIVHTGILECPPELTLHEAARRMSAARVSSILVVENDIPIGIWTERDALAVDFDHPDSFDRPIRDVMSAPVRTVARDLSLQELAVRFRDEHMRHYLVVDPQGRRCGIVTQTDVVLNQGIEHYLKLRKLDTIIKGNLQPLPPSASLGEAARQMREAARDAVVVAYEDGSYGILTERDLTRLVAERAGNRPVGELASRPLITVGEDASLYRVRCMLSDRGIRHVGVLRHDGSLTDVVSFADILSGMELSYVQELQHALRQRDLALNASQRNLHLAEKIIETTLEGILITDDKARIISVNPAFTRLTGYRPEEVIGRNPSMLSSGRQTSEFYQEMWSRLQREGQWQGEIWNRRKSGEIYPELLTITAIKDRDGKLTHYAAVFSDISQLKENEARIRHLAYYDPLTSLPNRRLLEDRLQVAMAHAHRHRKRAAVLFIDLDRFKRINDSLGHEIGDRLLIEIARRLSACLREDDTVARMGGDEFIAVLSDLTDPDDAAHTAARIIEALRRPVEVDGHELTVTTSIGISVFPDDGRDPAVLVKNADIAMYRAKEEGRNAFQLYQPAMNARSLEHLALENALHRAIDCEELVLHFQPLVQHDTGQTVAAEALLRWQHPELGLVPPGEFIPLAEETGLIVPIGEWVLRAACLQHARWREAGHGHLHMQVNISARQFRDENFTALVARVIAETGMPAAQLTLELTETMLMEDSERTVSMLNDLRALGVRLALDDFGTGYSSLAYLKRFPINELKIDRLFTRDIDRNPGDAAIVEAIIRLAHSLGQRVVAEGVESAAQRAILARYGCDLMQGFHFGHPTDATGFLLSCQP